MKTLEELKELYYRELLPDLAKLEETRKKTVHKIFLICGPIAVLGGLLTFYFFKSSSEPDDFITVLIVTGIVCSLLGWWLSRGYVSDFKDRIISRIVHFLEPSLTYDKTGYIGRDVFEASSLFGYFNRFSGDDRVTGKLGATEIDFSELLVKKETGSGKNRRVVTIFKGLFFVADFNKEFQHKTLVLPDTAERIFGGFGNLLQSWNVGRPDLIKLEDPEFEKLFAVYGDDDVEARYILSTSLMSRIVNFKKRTARRVSMSFCNSCVYIAITFSKNLFEPKIFETILNFQPIEEYFENLSLAIDIVEDLNLNTRIWTKV